MATSIFICYRKELGYAADILRLAFEQDDDFTAWMDDNLGGGVEWETEIYTQLLKSDVVLVTIGADVGQSEWVRREIGLARALGISILPVAFDLDDAGRQAEMTALGINGFQWVATNNLRATKTSELVAELRDHIDAARKRTEKSVPRAIEPLLHRDRPEDRKADDNSRAATYVMPSAGSDVKLHVTSGNIAAVRDIDVLVSSENDWMQMARFFERRTVSSILRRLGSRQHGGKYQDTIQNELDWQLRDSHRPVPPAAVFVTCAGAPESDLADENKARYIFHVAAVAAVDAEAKVVPYTEDVVVKKCVRSCLSKVREVDAAQGVISPPDSDQRLAQEKRAEEADPPIRSILLPLFGCGQGGADSAEVIGPIVDAITEFLTDPDHADIADTLEDIYISAFTVGDLDTVRDALQERLATAPRSPH